MWQKPNAQYVPCNSFGEWFCSSFELPMHAHAASRYCLGTTCHLSCSGDASSSACCNFLTPSSFVDLAGSGDVNHIYEKLSTSRVRWTAACVHAMRSKRARFARLLMHRFVCAAPYAPYWRTASARV